ncbi:hypothetical protein T8K17_05600 [Thalassobaculum sp. OXR-137]|uniref:hypothetical protein n=1 Tax=Thalassobaculum sp. OXR-137 TaxID=3100173 RepID=UPI002AC91B5F|nr:hypothetical protein [Thalassobaculum sp. OXR-137]WPZ35616.1 hypothetical protein T8K17_05600 [Thalassobaculum sp. OXR-137]
MDTYKYAQELVRTDPVEAEKIYRRIFTKTGLNLNDIIVSGYERTDGIELFLKHLSRAARDANKVIENNSEKQNPNSRNYVDLDKKNLLSQ